MSLVNKAELFLMKFRVRLSHRPKLKHIFQSVTPRNLICECFQCVFVRKKIFTMCVCSKENIYLSWENTSIIKTATTFPKNFKDFHEADKITSFSKLFIQKVISFHPESYIFSFFFFFLICTGHE